MGKCQRKGVALVLSAPSGAGKSTLAKRLLIEFTNLRYSVSCTTRAPRPGEIHGRDYYFISREEFLCRREGNAFVEWAEVHGNLYGTPLPEVLDALDAGRDLLFDIDVQGAGQLRLRIPDAVLAFILPPGPEELAARLARRGNDSPESISLRLKNAAAEIRQAVWYDALILNDDLDIAYDGLRSIYIGACLASTRNANLLRRAMGE